MWHAVELPRMPIDLLAPVQLNSQTTASLYQYHPGSCTKISRDLNNVGMYPESFINEQEDSDPSRFGILILLNILDHEESQTRSQSVPDCFRSWA